MKLPRRKESDILSSCLRYLKARGIICFRMQVGAMKRGNRYVPFGTKGQADILCFPSVKGPCGFRHPHPLWVETKRIGCHQTAEQKRFASVVSAEGHSYIVVHSAEELSLVL
jgi:hypothetical protein